MNIDIKEFLKESRRKVSILIEKTFSKISSKIKVFDKRDTTLKSKYYELYKSNNVPSFNNSDDATAWAKENLSVEYVDYNDLTRNVANNFNKTLAPALCVLPELKSYIRRVTSDDKLKEHVLKDDDWLRRTGKLINKVNKNEKFDNIGNLNESDKNRIINITAHRPNQPLFYGTKEVYGKYSGIFFSQACIRKVGNYNWWEEQMVKEGKKGKTVTAENPMHAVICHEVGHALYEFLIENTNFLTEYKEISEKLLKNSARLQKHVSKFAGTDEHELFSECIAKYLTHKRPGKVSKQIGMLVEKYIKEYRKINSASADENFIPVENH